MNIAGVFGGGRGSGNVGNEVFGGGRGSGNVGTEFVAWRVDMCDVFGEGNHPESCACAFMPADDCAPAVRNGASNFCEVDNAACVAQRHSREQ